jgi:hypothetical protein
VMMHLLEGSFFLFYFFMENQFLFACESEVEF